MVSRSVAKVIFLLVLVGLSVAFLVQVSPSSLPRFEHADKVVHFGAFFVLALTFHRAFPIPIWAGLIILTAYGLAIEWVQDMLPYRTGSFGDLLADAAGAASYYAFFGWHFERKRQQKKRNLN